MRGTVAKRLRKKTKYLISIIRRVYTERDTRMLYQSIKDNYKKGNGFGA